METFRIYFKQRIILFKFSLSVAGEGFKLLKNRANTFLPSGNSSAYYAKKSTLFKRTKAAYI